MASICLDLGATTYLAGHGAVSYEDAGAYAKYGIKLVTSDFQPFPYPQIRAKAFVPGLSIMDALLNIGQERLGDVLQGMGN